MLQEQYPEGEFIILSTCNRSEIYVARPLHGPPKEEELRSFFGSFHGLPREQYDDSLYLLADSEAVRHLFDVACGLDSLVTGEDQILAQMKEAFRLARELQSCRGRLIELFQSAFTVAKEVRRETQVSTGRSSVASVAVTMAQQKLADLTNCTALSVGAGKMNELMLKGLLRTGIGRIIITNRSPERAAELARDCDGQVVPFAELSSALAQADVVVCSTASPDPVITAAKLGAVMAQRPDRPMLLIDIAVPRDVEPQAAQVPGVTLYNIDDLEAVVEKTVSLRDGQVDACREIIDAHVGKYFERLHIREVVPALESLYFIMRNIADEELSRVANKLTGDAHQDQEIFRRALHRTLRRILHRPIINLRSAAGTQIAREHAIMLRKLFNLQADGSSSGMPSGMPPHARMASLMGRTMTAEELKMIQAHADAMPPGIQEMIMNNPDLAKRMGPKE
jgi:glutamyl-tRNA reductase